MQPPPLFRRVETIASRAGPWCISPLFAALRRWLGNHHRLPSPYVAIAHRAALVIASCHCLSLLGEAKLQRRRQELTQATPDQPVDDEAVYYNVADAAGLSQPHPPPPPPPHEQQQPPQIDPADPPQQQDNVDRDTQDWLTRDEQLGDT
ncbi:hypothetical protein Scep_024112 [Stephania cephalantha]|uniref:Uncharacterized protein n=1 Tax=Stephania cephalantha TaxID=152367 RepID=A0AAP0F1D1_9MAGN